MRSSVVAALAAVALVVLAPTPAVAQQGPAPSLILRGEVEPARPTTADDVVVPVQVSPAPEGGTLTASVASRELTTVPATTADGGPVRVHLGPLPAGTTTVTIAFSGDAGVAPSSTSFDVVVLGAEESFVRQAYRAVLNRAPDAPGLAAWVERLEAGADPAALALVIARSPESRRRVVTDLYWQALDRAPDAGGREHWVERLRGGLPTDEALAALLSSGEARSRGLAAPEALVDRLYRLHLDRDPDPSGAAHWEARVATAGARATALAFARTRPAAEAAVRRTLLAACGDVAPGEGIRLRLQQAWGEVGRDPGRQAALTVAWACPRLP